MKIKVPQNSPFSQPYKNLRKRRCAPCEKLFAGLAALKRHQANHHRVKFIYPCANKNPNF